MQSRIVRHFCQTLGKLPLRTDHTLLQNDKKLLIQALSDLQVTCLPSNQADESHAILPDNKSFECINGSTIKQFTTSQDGLVNQVRVPAHRGYYSSLI